MTHDTFLYTRPSPSFLSFVGETMYEYKQYHSLRTARPVPSPDQLMTAIRISRR